MPVYNATEQFAEINKANVEGARKLASLALEKTERLANFHLQSAKVALDQSASSASALAVVKDVQELFALRTKLAETGVQYATAYSRGIFEVASETQADLSALAQEAWTAYAKGVETWVEKAGESAPAGSEIVVTALKSTVAATTAVFDQLSKAAKQTANIADSSFRAATAAAAEEAKPAKGRKSA